MPHPLSESLTPVILAEEALSHSEVLWELVKFAIMGATTYVPVSAQEQGVSVAVHEPPQVHVPEVVPHPVAVQTLELTEPPQVPQTSLPEPPVQTQLSPEQVDVPLPQPLPFVQDPLQLPTPPLQYPQASLDGPPLQAPHDPFEQDCVPPAQPAGFVQEHVPE